MKVGITFDKGQGSTFFRLVCDVVEMHGGEVLDIFGINVEYSDYTFDLIESIKEAGLEDVFHIDGYFRSDGKIDATVECKDICELSIGD